MYHSLKLDVVGETGERSEIDVAPTCRIFNLNGEFIGLKCIDRGRGNAVVELPVNRIIALKHEGLEFAAPGDILAELDVRAREVDDGTPVDPKARRAFLSLKGAEKHRTQGRHIDHVPEGAFRFVYSHGIDRRRVKDAYIVAVRRRTDTVVIRDVTGGPRQWLAVPTILSMTVPRSGTVHTDEDDIRAAVRRASPERRFLARCLRLVGLHLRPG